MCRKRSSRRFQFENLESRQLMAADLYLDFGAAFNANASQTQHVFQVEKLTDNRVNAPTTTGSGDALPAQLTSLTDALVSRNIDYDQNGVVNALDADALAQDVTDIVSRTYEPFTVNVKIVGSANMNQVINKLATDSTNDVYVLVAGRHPIVGEFGVSKIDTGNTQDNVSFVYAENLLDKAASIVSDGVHPWAYLASALARSAAHEAGHAFGLRHLLEEADGATADQAKLGTGDMMFTADADSGTYKYLNLATRWNGLPDNNGSTQNAFEVLVANVGLRANGPAYVTGTGAHDTIRIDGAAKGLANGQAQVTVSAFRDAAHTDLIESQSYKIDTANGIIVEAGRRDDRVEVLNLSVPVTLRGGQGDDELIGSVGNDMLEGDTGNDHLLGGAGSDTYLFRGPRYQDLNRDDIDDTSGTDDTLDLSQLNYAINVNLAATTSQEIERRPTTTFTVNGVVEEIILFTSPFNSRLDLDLKTGSGSTGIENVRGSRFNDRIYGNELDNKLFGNAGDDWLFGYDGSDTLSGGLGNDILRGGNARDYLFGDSGRDQLFGEAGDDYLDGGFDGLVDVLNGGDGSDEFVQYFRPTTTSVPYAPIAKQTYQLVEGEDLADFNASLGDRIVMRTVWPTV